MVITARWTLLASTVVGITTVGSLVRFQFLLSQFRFQHLFFEAAEPVVSAPLNSTSSWFPEDEAQIRRWGCERRTETPFIYLHIGKSGGGSVRARFAASSLDYNRTSWRVPRDNSYYPVRDRQNGKFHNGTFCHSGYSNRRPSHIQLKTFEGKLNCDASTPLGRAIACPTPAQKYVQSEDQNGMSCYPPLESETCRVVYVGHNHFGSEMHWLPAGFLSRWWSDRWAPLQGGDKITPLLETLLPQKTWCTAQNSSRPYDVRDYNSLYQECSLPLQDKVDTLATEAVARKLGLGNNVQSWSPIYASLPLLRVTLLREPIPWLLSKFSWHQQTNALNLKCDDIESALHGGDGDAGDYPRFRSGANVTKGWASQMALQHILQLCGEDCMVRNGKGTSSVFDLERQARDNLRRSFAVVGLLNETDVFYKMVTARVDYMNTSLNSEVTGARHPSNTDPYCKELYSDPSFQQRLINGSQSIAALVRLHKVAVEVNHFQLKEMQECGFDIG